jgi:hypothetical protein
LHRKSIEQIAVESLRQLFDLKGSPEAILRVVRSLPHPGAAAVDDLEAAIISERLPVRDPDTFDQLPQGDLSPGHKRHE